MRQFLVVYNIIQRTTSRHPTKLRQSRAVKLQSAEATVHWRLNTVMSISS